MMPRPQRYRDREGSAAPAPEPANATVAADSKPPAEDQNGGLDVSREAAADSTGSLPEGERAFIEATATRLGWKPKTDWPSDRSPEGWQDAPEFLEGTVAANLKLKEQKDQLAERNKRLMQVAESMASEAREEGRKQAEQQLRAAVRAGDEAGAAQAAQQMARPGPDPKVAAWMAENAWYQTHESATLLARVVAQKEANKGASTETQLSVAEAEVKRAYPELFGEAPRTAPEPRPLPVTAPGSRGAVSSAPKIKGWADIPSGDRSQMTKAFEGKLMRRGLTQDQVRQRLASQYWATKEAAS